MARSQRRNCKFTPLDRHNTRTSITYLRSDMKRSDCVGALPAFVDLILEVAPFDSCPTATVPKTVRNKVNDVGEAFIKKCIVGGKELPARKRRRG